MGWDDEETEHIPVQGTVKRATDKAILLELPNGNEQWVPRSVIFDGDIYDEGDTNPEIAEWFCEKEGLA